MAISTYNGTNPSSASGYFRRYFSEFKDARGVAWRLEILDSVTTSDGFPFADNSPVEFLLGRDGVTINWDGDSDHLHDPIVGSTLSADFLLEGSHHTVFPEVLAGSAEDRFAVALFRHEPGADSTSSEPTGKWRPEWMGILAPEGVEYISNESNQFLRLSAHDGLAMLNDIPYQQANGEVYDTDTTLAGHLSRALEKIPTSTLWSFDSDGGTTALSNSAASSVEFLSEISFIGCKNQLTHTANEPDRFSVLSNIRAKAVAFYEVQTSTDQFGGTFATKTTTTSGQVVTDIATLLGARVFMAEGRFWFVHWAALDDRTARIHSFRNTGHLASRSYSQTTTDTTDGRLDLLDEGFDALFGLKRKFLFPVKRSVSVHTKGGAKVILSGNSTHTPLGGQDPEVGVYFLKDSTGTATELSSPTAVVVGGDSPLILGNVRGISTGKGLGAFDLAVVGMKAVLEMKVKVGNKYLRRNITSASASNSVNIHRTSATDFTYLDFTGGTIEWTTDSAARYHVVIPHLGMDDPEPPVVLQGEDNDIERVGGFHLDLRNNETEFKYSSGLAGLFGGDGTEDGRFASFDLEFVLPATEDNVDEHVGIEFSARVLYYSRENVLISPASVTALDDLNGEAGRIANLKILSTNDTSDADVLFVSDNTENRATIKAAETILGDAYSGGQGPGTLQHRQTTDGAFVSTSSDTWRTMESPTLGHYVHELLAELTAQERAKILETISGTFAFDPSQAVATYNPSAKTLPSFLRLWGYEIGSTTKYFAPFSLSWVVRSTSFDVEGFLVDVDRNIGPVADDNKDKVGEGSGAPGGIPNGQGIQRAILGVKTTALNADGGTGLTQAQQDKLAAITINGSGQITDFDVPSTVDVLHVNNITSAATSNSVAINLGYISDIQRKTDNITTNASHQITAISTAAGAIAAASIFQTSSAQFATATQLANIGVNAGNIATNTTDIATNGTNISSITTIVKSATGGGGKGIYNDPSSTAESFVGLTASSAHLQGGANTSVDLEENSPGTIEMKVQTGPSGSEVATTAITIEGTTTAGTATTTFNKPTSGISYADLDGTPTIPAAAADLSDVTSAGSGAIITSTERTKLSGLTKFHGILLDGSGGGIGVGSGSISFAVGDLFANGEDGSQPGIYLVTTAFTFSQDSSEVGALAEFNSHSTKYKKVGAPAGLSLADLDDSTASDVFTDSLSQFAISTTGSLSLTSSAAILLVGNVTAIGAITTTSNLTASGTPTLGGLTYPTSDGTSGQVLTTNGSGTLSFATASGSSGPIIHSNISGRFTWSSADDGERIHLGNFSYGPFNWYSFTSEPSNSTFRNYSASDAVGTTNYNLSTSHLLGYGMQIPTTDKKIRIRYVFRLQNAPASSTWGLSLWGADLPNSGTGSSRPTTLRAETADITRTTNSSSLIYHGTFETSSNFDEDMALILAENRSGSLTSTTYMYAQFQIELID